MARIFKRSTRDEQRLAEDIRRAIERDNLSSKELVARGLTEKQARELVSADAKPKSSTLTRTAEALGVEPRYEKSRKWWVEFTDHHDLSRRMPCTISREESEQIGRHIERLVACRVARTDPDPRSDLAYWLEGLPPSFIERLVRFDLLDSQRLAAGRPLAEHIEEYRKWLKGRKRNATHVTLTVSRIERIVEQAGVKHWSALFGRIESALTAIQTAEGFKDQTRNAYLTAIKGWCNWMLRMGKAAKSPAAGIEPLPIEAREHRRALTEDEARRLIAAAASGPVRAGRSKRGRVTWQMTGPQRAVLYSVALQTGLRAGALRRLKVSDFDLDAEDSPTVTVKGQQGTKNKRDMVQALQPRTAALLAEQFKGKLRAAPAFNMPPRTDTADMLRADLADARRAWLEEAPTPEQRAKWADSDFLAEEDAQGRRVDFHALRTTTGTMLALLDVPRAITTRIMGHASYATTDKFYTRVGTRDRRSAIDNLPDLAPAQAVMAATGTDAIGRVIVRDTGRNMPNSADKSGQKGGGAGSGMALKSAQEKTPTVGDGGVYASGEQARVTGLEPATSGSTVRCSYQLSYTP